MYRNGHVGFALLTYAPVVTAVTLFAPEYLLLVAIGGLAMFDLLLPVSLATGWNVSLSLAMLPDLDVRVSWLEHRGITHTVWFALATAGVCAVLGYWTFGFAGDLFGLSPTSGALFFGYVGFHSILTHILADALTPMGIRPFTPVSGREYTLSLVRAKNQTANTALLLAGLAATSLALFAETVLAVV